jgi:translation initiation factor 2A
MEEVAAIELPSIQLCLRSKDGMQFISGSDTLTSDLEFTPSIGNAVYSANGNKLAVIEDARSVVVFDAEDGMHNPLIRIDRKAVHAVHLSPKGRFLLTWEKPEQLRASQEDTEEKESSGQLEGNLIVWDTTSGEIHARFFQKRYKPEEWPYLLWSDDEHLACRLVTNEIHFFEGENIAAGIVRKLRLQNVENVSLAPIANGGSSRPRQSYFFVAYTTGSKGSPCKCALYEYPLMNVLSSKSFFNSDSVEISWSYNGEYALTKGITEVQKDSYYGSAKLFLLSRRGDALNVIGETETSRLTVSDVKWSPTQKEFILIYGRVATLHTAKDATAIFEFGSGHWNTVRYNPQGTLIMLGGFGNMAGDFKIWERATLKEIGSANAHGSKMFEWAPDGLRFLTASIFPWRRVDNELKIWKYNGELLQWLKFEELYQVVPRSFQDSSVYKAVEFPASYVKHLNNEVKKKSKEASKSVFVPIHLRNKPAAAPVKILHAEEQKPKHLVPQTTQPKVRVPVGMTVSAEDAKKKKRTNINKPNPEAKPNQQPQQQQHSRKDSSDLISENPTPEQLEKKIKHLRKKLRQISQLKDKSSSSLTPEELEKVSKESELVTEISELEDQFAKLSA